MTDYTDAIREVYSRATTADLESGRAWYPTAYRIASAIADWTGTPADRVAAAMAALSPRNPWAWNVQDAAAYALAAARGDAEAPTATTFTSNRDRAWAMVRGDSDWRTSALKVRSFVANICGDPDAVTVDVWAIRVATLGAQSEVKSDRQYRDVADAYRTVAAEVGESPRNLQAITWLVAQREGMGQKRPSKVRRPKSGTFPLVLALLGH